MLLPVLALASGPHLVRLDDRLRVRDEEIRLLRRTPMLGLLPVPIIEHLAGRLRRLSVPAGATVVEQGTAGDEVFVITHGRADVVGDGRPVRTLGEGDGFGEVAVVDRITRTATVRARTDLDLLALDGDDFLAAIGSHDGAADAARATVDRHLAAFRPLPVGA
jgi:CRP-like cAMP-binding protein